MLEESELRLKLPLDLNHKVSPYHMYTNTIEIKFLCRTIISIVSELWSDAILLILTQKSFSGTLKR